MNNSLYPRSWLIAPLVIILILAPWASQLDLFFSRLFYDPATGFSHASIYQFIYHYALYPAWIFSGAAIAVLISSLWRPRMLRWRQPALVLIITFVIGSGLVTNGLMKSYWGRPRPRQVEEFGGDHKFRAFYNPNFSSTLKGNHQHRSFPSGHASTGFFFFTLTVIGRRLKSQRLMVAGILSGIFLGGLLSLSRIAEGGHFFSDCICAGVVMWLVALAADRFTSFVYN